MLRMFIGKATGDGSTRWGVQSISFFLRDQWTIMMRSAQNECITRPRPTLLTTVAYILYLLQEVKVKLSLTYQNVQKCKEFTIKFEKFPIAVSATPSWRTTVILSSLNLTPYSKSLVFALWLKLRVYDYSNVDPTRAAVEYDRNQIDIVRQKNPTTNDKQQWRWRGEYFRSLWEAEVKRKRAVKDFPYTQRSEDDASENFGIFELHVPLNERDFWKIMMSYLALKD